MRTTAAIVLFKRWTFGPRGTGDAVVHGLRAIGREMRLFKRKGKIHRNLRFLNLSRGEAHPRTALLSHTLHTTTQNPVNRLSRHKTSLRTGFIPRSYLTGLCFCGNG